MSAIATNDVAAFLYREARLLDDEAWDEWLECYHPDAEFWMPSWDDDDTLIDETQAIEGFVMPPHDTKH